MICKSSVNRNENGDSFYICLFVITLKLYLCYREWCPYPLHGVVAQLREACVQCFSQTSSVFYEQLRREQKILRIEITSPRCMCTARVSVVWCVCVCVSVSNLIIMSTFREVEKVSVCVICAVRTESVGHFLWNCPVYSERRALFLEHLKNNLGNEFEHFKSCDIARISHFILETELWGSHYEELLRLVKSYIIDIAMGIAQIKAVWLWASGTGPLQHQSQPGRDTACQGKGKFGKLEGEESCIVVYGSARSSECEAHAWPKRYGYHWSIIIMSTFNMKFLLI